MANAIPAAKIEISKFNLPDYCDIYLAKDKEDDVSCINDDEDSSYYNSIDASHDDIDNEDDDSIGDVLPREIRDDDDSDNENFSDDSTSDCSISSSDDNCDDDVNSDGLDVRQCT